MNNNSIDQQLNTLSRFLEPTESQSQRVKNVVFSQIPDDIHTTFYRDSMNSKNYFMPFLKFGLPIIAISFVLLPLLAFYVKPLRLFIEKDQASIAPMDLSTDSVREFEDEFMGMDGVISEISPEYIGGGIGSPLSTNLYDSKSEEFIEDDETAQRNRIQERQGELTIVVENVRTVYEDISKHVATINGYIQSSTYNSYATNTSATILARVPIGELDGYMQFVRDHADEITYEFIELYDKQNEIARIISEIDQQEAQLQSINDASDQKEIIQNQINDLELQKSKIEEQASYSTVSVTLNSSQGSNDATGFKATLNDVREAIGWVITFWFTLMVWSIVPLLFFLPVAIVLFVIV
ncbi:DUF4349 domain-containing protein, partial [Candidatus Dojkabacteria bacterium]|nr:DUF4349 domain-containing protein [Candidatus Dojkabacteria bacterium]